MAQVPIYCAARLSLPPKRIFLSSHDVKGVNKRRQELDVYLRQILRWVGGGEGRGEGTVSCL